MGLSLQIISHASSVAQGMAVSACVSAIEWLAINFCTEIPGPLTFHHEV